MGFGSPSTNGHTRGLKLREQFRRAAPSLAQVCAQVSDQRYKVRPSEYGRIVLQLKARAPNHAYRLLNRGPSHFKELAWHTPYLQAVSLRDELTWAAAWLKSSAASINKFRATALRVEALLQRGDVEDALTSLEEFTLNHGWSFWALELQCAIRANSSSAEEFKAWSNALLESAPDSVPGLLLHVFLDRNDKAVSYDAFYARCAESFPRFGHLGDWLPRYLISKSIVAYSSDRDICAVLSREGTSCVFDYYEALIGALETICTQDGLTEFRRDACRLISGLLQQGVKDHRLNKIKLALDGLVSDANLSEPAASQLARIEDLWVEDLDPKQIYSNASRLVSSVQEFGVASANAGNLLKFATNFHGLDSASALGLVVQDAVTDLVGWPCRSLGAAMASPYLSIEDVAGFTDPAARKVVAWAAQNFYDEHGRTICKSILGVLEGAPPEDLHVDTPLSLRTWTGRQLLLLNRCDEVIALADGMSADGLYAHRRAAKLKLLALMQDSRLTEAMNLLKDWILDSPSNITEFPIRRVFAGADWNVFRDFDPVLVATVAHHVSAATDSQSIAYICRMACRKFFLDGRRERVSEAYEQAEGRERALLISFLRDVWVEENLAMVHQLATTDAVRDERMSVLQLLLAWDDEHEHDYAQAIREITFVETIQSGLREINETRIFVNETGVARWAEKELSEDYERWSSMATQPAQQEIAAGMLRQLLIDPGSEEFVNALGNGRPTEADAALGSMVDRLLKRFLLDPADGLDAYLSLRIRHGTLRGTLFGSIEEQGLFYAASARSKAEFARRWMDDHDWDEQRRIAVQSIMEGFGQRLKDAADELVNERIQIRSSTKPRGEFIPKAPLQLAPALTTALRSQQLTLANFPYLCCFMFWQALEADLLALREYVQVQVKDAIQRSFDTAIAELRGLGSATVQLVAALTAAATATQAQCDAIGAWFRLPGGTDGAQYKLSMAIEVARAYAKNVHKTFSAEVDVREMPEQDPALTTLALAVLSDALFVIFENVWKHSGLGSDGGSMQLTVRFDEAVPALSILVMSRLSDETRAILQAGELERLRNKYIVNSPLELASQEGGSGFAKLARLSRYADRLKYQEPLSFGLQEDMWFTAVTIPMIRREAAYDALQ